MSSVWLALLLDLHRICPFFLHLVINAPLNLWDVVRSERDPDGEGRRSRAEGADGGEEAERPFATEPFKFVIDLRFHKVEYPVTPRERRADFVGSQAPGGFPPLLRTAPKGTSKDDFPNGKLEK